MPSCAIITCKNKSQTSSIDRGGISFHRFPKEPDVREQWIDVTGRENWISTKSSTICSRHFNENDFIIKKSGNRYLKPGAIPSERIVYIKTTPLPKTSSCASIIKKPCIDAEKPCIDDMISESKKICVSNQDLQGADNAKSITSNLVFTTSKKDSASTPRKRKLHNIIINKDYIIKKQRLQIKRLQAQNRRLKTKINKIEENLSDLQEKFFLKVEDVIIYC